MNELIYCEYIHTCLNEFIFDIKTLMAWRHTCKQNMQFKYYTILNTINNEQYYNKKNNMFNRIHDIFKVIQLDIIPFYFDDSYMINFKHLLYLNCSYTNTITDKSIQHLFNISVLYCNNVLTDVSLCKLTNLHILDLKDNIMITDKSLICLTNLKQLYINEICENISDISLSHLTNLTKLYLCNNKKCHITNESINKLTKLTCLHIMESQYIDNIELPNLKTLYVNQKLQDSSINCINLTRLYCDDNELFTDNLIYRLPNLILLNCNFNSNFTDKALYNLPNLTHLDCGFNRKFTDNGLLSLFKLKILHCAYNCNFTNNGLINLANLTVLDCGKNNNFTARGIVKLINLEELTCHYGKNNINVIDLKPLRKFKKFNGIIFHR